MITHKIIYDNVLYEFINDGICDVRRLVDGTYVVSLSNSVTLQYVEISDEEFATMFTFISPPLYAENDTNNEQPFYVDLWNVSEIHYSTSTNVTTLYVGVKNSTIKKHYKYSQEFIDAIRAYWAQ